MMPISAQLMRFLMVICLLGMALLAILSLRQRKLPLGAYIGWGLIAILLPLIGPFIVLLIRPGESRPGHPQ
jgi:energy-converting hydrogenase Eha subunit H